MTIEDVIQPPALAAHAYYLLWFGSVNLFTLSLIYVLAVVKAPWPKDPHAKAAALSGLGLLFLSVGAIARRFLLPSGDYIVFVAYAILSAALWWRVQDTLASIKDKKKGD